ncbi:MAG: hypothetical protein Q9M89_04590 [Persephonella sp.]|nr:hypothetical protein [Persephonella sp.]
MSIDSSQLQSKIENISIDLQNIRLLIEQLNSKVEALSIEI